MCALIENTDSDGSVDLDALIAEVDPAELERHLTPSTSPLPRHSPDPPALNSLVNITGMIAEEDENLSDTPLEVDGQEADDIMNSFSNANGFDMASKEYEDDEINEFDISLDTQITPILKPVYVPSPYSTLSGRKSGIPAGLPKTAFSAHFGPSLLSPTSSRASSIGDPDEYETMSNGSYTSVRSTGSANRVGSHVGSPSRIATPSRADSHFSTPTPQRSRSLSVVSDSSTEENTTSSVGATLPLRIASPT
ncbi:hypothetical protein C1645_813261 [Glomus cerebriforme]|uniref:Uncharacterized protein n=1 Tax=Glomus cerebriforme TaxID=658196 RepID=A0A397TJB5_9GLOM|nr:hypothetical protein C1645_813261 [Glomus cerebriforme]